MNIYINGRFLAQSVTGVQRYAHEMVKALDAMIGRGDIDSECFRLVLLAPGNLRADSECRFIPLRHVGHLSGHIWEQLELPFHTRDGVLISLTNAAPLFKRKQLVTIHDAAVFAFPEAYSFLYRSWYRVMMKQIGRSAGKIVTVSNFSRNELITYCHVAADKIRVIYEGKEHITAQEADKSILQRHNLVARHYLLAFGSPNPNKNIQSVIAAVGLPGLSEIKVVVVGGSNPKVFKSSHAQGAGNIVNVGYVTDSELRALYEHALCLVYPSYYEGFGLPPLEAFACGCPVIVSSAASLPEICRGAALYCNPYDSTDIAFNIQCLISDVALRNVLCRNGKKLAERLSWNSCAESVFAVIRELCA